MFCTVAVSESARKKASLCCCCSNSGRESLLFPKCQQCKNRSPTQFRTSVITSNCGIFIQYPATMNDSKTLCCLCCVSAPITAEVHIDRRGYVPGEFISVNANVENGSSSKLPSTSASIIQNVTFKATTHSKTFTNKVIMVQGQGLDAGQSMQWNNQRLKVPALPPSMLRFCNIIDIQYLLQFRVVTPCGSRNLKLNVPIQLGNIPVQGFTPYSIPFPINDFPAGAPPAQPSALPNY